MGRRAMVAKRKIDTRQGNRAKVRRVASSSDDESEESIEEESEGELRQSIRPPPKTEAVVPRVETIVLSSEDSTDREDEDTQVGEGEYVPWAERPPATLGEVAIHPRKLTDLRRAMEAMLKTDAIFGFQCRVLVCSGPAGSCKSTAVKMVARELLPRPVVEYSTPQTVHSGMHDGTSSTTAFSEFLRECAVLTGRNKRFVVVDDFPNVYHQPTKEDFHTALREWCDIDKHVDLPPIVLIVTEYETPFEFANSGLDRNFIAETLLTRDILFHRRVARVKFNPVAKTYLKKCLLALYAKNGALFAKVQKKRVMEEIDVISTNYGDVRSAITTFEFWARFHSRSSKSIATLGKENTMGIFNALGKIIYGTQHREEELVNYRKIQVGEYKPEAATTEPQIDAASVANVLKDFGAQATTFNLSLLENYTGFNSQSLQISEELEAISNDLSLADLFGRDDEQAANIGMRSVRVHMRQIGESMGGTMRHDKLKFTRQWKVQQRQNQTRREIEEYKSRKARRRVVSRVSHDESNLLDGFYEPLILNRRHRVRIPRVGGVMNQPILADSEIAIEDDYFSRVKSAREAEHAMFGLHVDDDELESDDSDPIVDSDEERANALSSDSELDNFI